MPILSRALSIYINKLQTQNMGLMEARWENIVPFIAMALMEACTIALTILAKTALTGGMSPFVFIVYTNALGSLVLLPYSFFFHRDER